MMRFATQPTLRVIKDIQELTKIIKATLYIAKPTFDSVCGFC